MKTWIVLALLLGNSALAINPAQGAPSRLDSLNERLEEAKAEINRIQSKASSVEAQIGSIDEQIAAVEKAFDASDDVVRQTQIEIAALEQSIAREEELYDGSMDEAQQLAEDIYKSGAEELEFLFSSEDIGGLLLRVEYLGIATEQKTQVMDSVQRIKRELETDQADLEPHLAKAIEARGEQLSQAQHLQELRRAQTTKLGALRKHIEGQQLESAAIAARSESIRTELARQSPARAVNGSAASSGQLDVLAADASPGFVWPLDGLITSGFGPRWGRLHAGIDIDGVTGTSIRASRSGTVVTASYDAAGYGYYVVIDHGDGLASLYAHASELYVDLEQNVAQGESIAAVGNTGSSTGDHLHFEIRLNGTPQNPLLYLP